VSNCSSLEISKSDLGIIRPEVVQELDLANTVWPEHLRGSPTFPQVTLYYLMSASRSYTDFHIDLGGSSVFYHILHGQKTFLFIPPTHENLEKYEEWCRDRHNLTKFFGDEVGVSECIRVDLKAGDTAIIPSAWIHTMYTPMDSIVLGGNFLTELHLGRQLKVDGIEERTRTEDRLRFPSFYIVMLYTALVYLDWLPPNATSGMSSDELEVLKQLAEWLWKKAKLKYSGAKGDIPDRVNARQVATRFVKWVFKGEEKPGWYSEMLEAEAEADCGLSSKKKRKRNPPPNNMRRSRRKGCD
jgi:JmjC domain, hydroxylase